MDFYKLFYLMVLGDKLSTLFGWIGVLSTVFLILNVIILAQTKHLKIEDSMSETWFVQFNFLKKLFSITCPLFLTFWCLLPNKKEAVLIIGGGYVGNFITNDSSSKRLPSDIVYFLRSNLQLAAKEAQVEINNLTQKDTLQDKSKEELIKLLKQK